MQHSEDKRPTTGTRQRTFSIALLVGASFDAFLAFLSLGIDALLADAILDTAQTRPGVVALLARLLAMSARILDLAALGAHRLRELTLGEI